jgi:AcrR family transcriptional regulator
MTAIPHERVSTRRYRSAKREMQASETRSRILAAAGAEFERSGYAATTLRRVAEAAGVSVPTVELSFATKPQLLAATISFAIRGDAEPRRMLERPWARSALQASSLDAFLKIVDGVLVDSARRSAGLVLAAFEAARQDASIAVLADQLRGQRTETAAWLVDGLVARAPLRAGIEREQAIDTVWLLMDPYVFRTLTIDRGWTPKRVGSWFGESVRRLLLADESPTAAGTDPGRGRPVPSSYHEPVGGGEVVCPTQPDWRMP